MKQSTQHTPRMVTGNMVITDLDGTLFRSDHTFSDTDIQTLTSLKDKGVIRVLATGRSIFSIERSVKKILPIDYLIFSTGAGIAHYPDPFANILKSNSLSKEETEGIIDFLESVNVDYMVQKKIPDNHIFSYRYKSKNNADFTTRLQFYDSHCSKLDVRNISASSQILVIVPDSKGEAVLQLIKSQLPQFSVIKATSPFDGKTIWIEIFAPGTSKSSAVSWLTNHLGILQKDTIAIGNDYNDEDLLLWADTGFVVNNAPDELKLRFHTVASNNNCGVSEAIKSVFSL